MIVSFVSFLVAFFFHKKFSSCVYGFYNYRLEIQTSSKVVFIKYSAISKIEIESLIDDVHFSPKRGVQTIKITPIMQQGRKIETKHSYRDFVYYLHFIEHAEIFVQELNNLRGSINGR